MPSPSPDAGPWAGLVAAQDWAGRMEAFAGRCDLPRIWASYFSGFTRPPCGYCSLGAILMCAHLHACRSAHGVIDVPDPAFNLVTP